MDNILRQVIEAETESKKQVHIKEEDVNGLSVIEIKYKDDFYNKELRKNKAINIVNKYLKKGYVIDCDYIDNKLKETIIIMSKG